MDKTKLDAGKVKCDRSTIHDAQTLRAGMRDVVMRSVGPIGDGLLEAGCKGNTSAIRILLELSGISESLKSVEQPGEKEPRMYLLELVESLLRDGQRGTELASEGGQRG